MHACSLPQTSTCIQASDSVHPLSLSLSLLVLLQTPSRIFTQTIPSTHLYILSCLHILLSLALSVSCLIASREIHPSAAMAAADEARLQHHLLPRVLALLAVVVLVAGSGAHGSQRVVGKSAVLALRELEWGATRKIQSRYAEAKLAEMLGN